MNPPNHSRGIAAHRHSPGAHLRLFLLMIFVGTLCARPAIIEENFSTDPLARGWRIEGDRELFRWDPELGRLQGTWDSSRPNTFFYLPLPTILSRSDPLRFAFSILLDDVQAPAPDGSFQLAIGLLRRADAFETNFFRGAGVNATWGVRNIVEFDYFPASSSIASTFSSVAVGTNNLRWTFLDIFPLEMTPGEWFRVEVAVYPDEQRLELRVEQDGELVGTRSVPFSSSFTDFRVDAFSVTSYSGEHQPANYGGQILAHGWVDDIAITFPEPPKPSLALTSVGPAVRISLTGREGWVPRLERSQDLQSWSALDAESSQNGDQWELTDNSPPPDGAAYRVQLLRP